MNNMRNLSLNYSRQNMCFGGQQSFIKINDNIYIDKANIPSQVKAINGEIYISNSTLQDKISAVNGDVVIINSHAKSNVTTANGDIYIKDCSNINGQVCSTNGNVSILNSKVTGNVKTNLGSVGLTNADISGTLETDVSRLRLQGQNKIGRIVFNDKQGINYVNNNGNFDIMINNCVNTGLFSSFIRKLFSGTKKVPVFTLPKGTEVLESIQFNTKKAGILYLEKGADFVGKIVNGTIKRL